MLHRGAWHKLESVGVVWFQLKKDILIYSSCFPVNAARAAKVRAGSQVDVPPCAGRLLQDWHLEECAVAYIVFVRTLKDVSPRTDEILPTLSKLSFHLIST